MEGYIKYKRIYEIIEESEVQKFLDDLVVLGWDIIFYDEKTISMKNYESVNILGKVEIFNIPKQIQITMIVGKRQERKL